MHLNALYLVLADAASPAPGQPPPPAGLPSLFAGPLLPIILMVVVVYFMMLRPQQQQRNRHAELLKNLKSGDRVATASGIVGVVITVKDRTVSLRSADAKLEVTKASVTDILTGGDAES